MDMTPTTPQPAWWHELNCRDALSAISFYGRTLGWRFDEIPLPGGATYRIARQNGLAICGIFEIDPLLHGDLPDHWMTYMATADIAVALRSVTFAGGRVAREPFLVPGLGVLALVEDAGGAFIGLMEPHPAHPLRRAEVKTQLERVAELMEEL